MELLSQIEQRESARRERAWQLERLKDQEHRLRQDIARLEAQASNAAALEDVIADAGDVPDGLTTRGTRFLPGGHNVRDVLLLIATNALEDLRKLQAKRLTRLEAARCKLAETEAALAEFSG